MIVKKFKLKNEIINIRRYQDDLESKGWRLVLNGEDCWLEPIITKKLISSWFTIFYLKKVLLKWDQSHLYVYMKARPSTLVFTLICLTLLFVRVFMRESLEPSQMLIGFSVPFLMSTLVIFFALRSETLRDIKKCIVKKLS